MSDHEETVARLKAALSKVELELETGDLCNEVDLEDRKYQNGVSKDSPRRIQSKMNSESQMDQIDAPAGTNRKLRSEVDSEKRLDERDVPAKKSPTRENGYRRQRERVADRAPSHEEVASVGSPRSVGSESWSDARRGRGMRSMSPGGSERVNRLYEHGKESARRRRESTGRSPAEEGCTFQPVTNKGRRQRFSSEERVQQSRFDLLYQQGKAAKAKREEMRSNAIKAGSPSFKPRINKSYVSTKQEVVQSKPRFEKLYDQANQRRQQLLEKQMSHQDAECTFEPKLMASSKAPKEGDKSGLDRVDELYQHAKRIEEKRRQVFENSAKQFTFQPRINKVQKSPSPHREGGISRMCPNKDELERKKKQQEELKLNREMQGCTFAPKLNPISPLAATSQVKPGDTPKRGIDVHSRLYEQAKIKQYRDKLNAHAQLGPPPSPNSAKSHRTTSSDTTGRIFDRLYEDGKAFTNRKLKEDRLAEDRRSSREWEKNRKECTFSPSIGEASRELAAKSARVTRGTSESQNTIFDRLHAESTIKSIKQEMAESDSLGFEFECTFQPKINETSKQIVERQWNESVRIRKERKSFMFLQKDKLSQTDVDFIPTTAEIENLSSVDDFGETDQEMGRPTFDASASLAQKEEEKLKMSIEARYRDENSQFLAQLVESDLENKHLVESRRSSWT